MPKLQEEREIIGEAKAKFHGFRTNTMPEMPERISVSAHDRICRVLLDSISGQRSIDNVSRTRVHPKPIPIVVLIVVIISLVRSRALKRQIAELQKTITEHQPDNIYVMSRELFWHKKLSMPKWLRIIISAIIVLFIFAATYPNVIGPGGVETVPFIYILCLSIIPFLLICIFAGRNKTAETVSWCIQLFFLIAVFMQLG